MNANSPLFNLSASPEISAGAELKRSGGARSAAGSEQFGPVLQQQTSKREQTAISSRPNQGSKSLQNKDQDAAQSAERGQIDDSSRSSRATDTNLRSGKTTDSTSPQNTDDVSDAEATAQETLELAQTASTEQGQQLQPGKIVPASGNFLPVGDISLNKTFNQGLTTTQTDVESLLSDDGEAGHVKSDITAESLLAKLPRSGANTTLQQGDSKMEPGIDNAASGSSNTSTAFAAALNKSAALGQTPELLGTLVTTGDAATAGSDSENALTATQLNTLAGAEKLAATKTSATNATPTTFQLDGRVGSQEWNNQVGDKIRWMSKADISTAEMKLNPAELGSIEIKIYTEDQQTRVSFITSSAAAKEMIEASLPRLREMLLNNGLQLEQSDISHRNDTNKQSPQESAIANNSGFDEKDSLSAQLLVSEKLALGQIDHYV